jgi:hypothetical protein
MWFETDVSGLRTCPIFEGQAFKEERKRTLIREGGIDTWLGGPKTSVSIYLTPRKNSEDGRIWLGMSFNIQGGSNMTGTNCDLFTHK